MVRVARACRIVAVLFALQAVALNDLDPGVTLSDLNGDDNDDVLLRHADGRWFYYPMDGRRSVADERGTANLTRNGDWRFAGTGDLNGDGNDDVLLRHVDGRWFYYPMDGQRSLADGRGTANLTRNLDWRFAGIGDLNGDGNDDVLLRHVNGRWFYYPMDGRRSLADGRGTASLTRNLDWRFAGIGDLNGDGNDDVLLRHANGRWFYYPMDGRRNLADGRGTANLTRNLDWRFTGIGDLNGDGNDDVLLRHADGRWFYYPMAGRRNLAGERGTANLTRNIDWRYAGIGDLNGDGNDDVLLRHRDGRWQYYPMDGRRNRPAERGSAAITTNLQWSSASSAALRAPILNAIPSDGVAAAAAAKHINIAHIAPPELAFSYTGGCQPTGVPLRRTLVDLSEDQRREVVDHQLRCEVGANTSYRVAVDGRGVGGARYRGRVDFYRRGDEAPQLAVHAQDTIPAVVVNEFIETYVDQYLIEVDPDLAPVARRLINELADREWPTIYSKDAVYDVVSRRVSYGSPDPHGRQGSALTGLVTMPAITDVRDFKRRDRVVVLSHATGSTPGDRSPADGWHVMANLLAGRGFLVVAPDNWGRGGVAPSDEPETYLMANPVATNSLDMIEAILANEDYRAFHNPDDKADLAVIGYSQGAHSAIALWLASEVRDAEVNISDLYVGGGPLNLHQSLIGSLQRIDGSCDGNPWCADVDIDTALPYFTDRILPGYLKYTNTGLARHDVVEADRLTEDFVQGMLNGDARYDTFKALMQLNSFTNLGDLAVALPESDTRIRLYHSKYDRLVTRQNTQQFYDVLSPDFDVTFLDKECSSTEYGVVADLTQVGLVHAICGIEMLDDTLRELAAR